MCGVNVKASADASWMRWIILLRVKWALPAQCAGTPPARDEDAGNPPGPVRSGGASSMEETAHPRSMATTLPAHAHHARMPPCAMRDGPAPRLHPRLPRRSDPLCGTRMRRVRRSTPPPSVLAIRLRASNRLRARASCTGRPSAPMRRARWASRPSSASSVARWRRLDDCARDMDAAIRRPLTGGGRRDHRRANPRRPQVMRGESSLLDRSAAPPASDAMDSFQIGMPHARRHPENRPLTTDRRRAAYNTKATIRSGKEWLP